MEHNLDFLKNELFISWKRQELSKLQTQKQKYTTRTGHLDTIFCNLGIKKLQKVCYDCVQATLNECWSSSMNRFWRSFNIRSFLFGIGSNSHEKFSWSLSHSPILSKKVKTVMGLQDALIEYIIIVCEFAIVKIVQVWLLCVIGCHYKSYA